MAGAYIIQESTLKSIADAIREQTESTEEILVSDIPRIIKDELGMSEDLSTVIAEQDALITELENLLEEKSTVDLDIAIAEQDALITELETLLAEKSSVQLPERENPAGAEHVVSGYESIDSDGNIIVGTHECPTLQDLLPEVSNPATASQILSGYGAIDSEGNSIAGTMPEVTQATPDISVSSAGLITSSTSQSGGYVSPGTKSATKQLDVQAATTITPSTSDQTAVSSGKYTTGSVVVKGDANLLPENIKNGVSIFGINGTMTSSQIQSSTTKASSTKKDTTATLTATGSTIDLAVIWAEDIYSPGEAFSEVALVVNGAIIHDHFGSYVTNEVTLSGNTITATLACDDVSDMGNAININIMIVSH